MSRQLPFGHDDQISDLDKAIHERIGRNSQSLRNQVIPAANTHRFKHGHRWTAAYSDRPEAVSETQTESTEITIPLQSIIDHDLSVLVRFISETPHKMHTLFLKRMYAMVGEVSEQTGNVVSGKDFKNSLKEALSKVHFGVDIWGVPSAPQLHAHPTVIAKLMESNSQPDPAYDEEIRRLTEQRKMEATQDEARRIARFKCFR